MPSIAPVVMGGEYHLSLAEDNKLKLNKEVCTKELVRSNSKETGGNDAKIRI